MKSLDFLKLISLEGIKDIDYSITTKCNLNCKGCRTKSPIVPPWFISLEQFLHDQKTLLRLGFSPCNLKLCLWGGDPLTHPNIIELINNSIFPLSMLTNGLGLLNQPKEFWKAVSDKKVHISISIYNRSKIPYDKVFKLLKDHNCSFNNADDYYQMINKEMVDSIRCKNHFLLSRINPKGAFNKKANFIHCCSMYPIIQNNKLYKCLIQNDLALNKIFHLNLTMVEGKDYLTLDKAKSSDEIIKFINTIPEYCRFCGSDGGHRNSNELILWEYSKKEITEWVQV